MNKSRFASLSEDLNKDTIKTQNAIKTINKTNENNTFKINNRKEELDKIDREIALSPNSFPEFIKSVQLNNKLNSKVIIKTTFIQKSKIIEPIKTEIIEPIKTEIIEPIKTEIEKKQNQDLAYNVYYSLVDLHEKRTNDYINEWGYDEWEKMFRFPNYNYSYFDDLDEEDNNEENND
jgi:hypothetical protein